METPGEFSGLSGAQSLPAFRLEDYCLRSPSIPHSVSAASPRILDWPAILSGLSQLKTDNPWVLENNVLVGGAACLFYRDLLEQINDPDFPSPTYSAEEEKVWLSRDADFATTEPGRMPDSTGQVPLGRLQMGFVLGADEFKENARTVRLEWSSTAFTMLIADPLDLWREKEAATHRRGRPQDSLHLDVLGLILQWETAHYAEKVASGEHPFEQWKARTDEVRRRWNSILNHPKLVTRLLALNVPNLTNYVSGPRSNP